MKQSAPGQRVPQPLAHDYQVTPGDLIRFELNARGYTQADLAARAGTSAKHLNQVIQDAVPLSADTALRLERTLGIPAVVLTQADAVNQSNKQRVKLRDGLIGHRDWYANFPKTVLQRLSIVDVKSSIETQIEDLLNYLAVADPDAYNAVYGEAALSFRRSQRWTVDPHVTALWLRSAELKADDLEVEPYNKAAFTELLEQLPEVTLLPMREAFAALQERCARVGVAVVFNPSLDGTRASAAVRWLGPERPVIVLTERGKFEDSVWFSFFHEAAHVVLHPRRRSLIELDGSDDTDGAETEANTFAKKVILRGRGRELSKVEGREELVAFAEKIGTHPGLVACIWAYDRGKSAWPVATRLRMRLDLSSLT
ncbi:XRE family transcriptional regulator [Aeromicrobium sp. HA]|uniref:XRE family transcriptional regulator n=1 Tax=Aeromicrobium sp. HA TaxID=3009077 RepID=UPI0022B024F1|nr:XRE family transcriptional regulator [Aeromicrobium sp. HA]